MQRRDDRCNKNLNGVPHGDCREAVCVGVVMGCIWLLNLTCGCVVLSEHSKGSPDPYHVVFLKYMSDCQHLKTDPRHEGCCFLS